ncbi:Alpha/beta hydrolase [Blastococcus aggregatus]|uniref:Alpha/beta hydrolase n=1 Tax=Blastococcus aggregatus TaxID=38502 RepID=A0A285V1J4_9ACTN|nr:alpha/beta hydrolase [Blastococcus aggregatus]SOC47478.1 Alpha/beta hydrolase [Blastococcus aggregatus]
MTDPEARLRAVAGWDVPALRGGLATLGELDDRFPSWRARLDAVVRTVVDGGTWSGPAAAQARELLLRLSTTAAALDAGLTGSRAECTRLAGDAAVAADRAAAALALAPELPVPLGVSLTDADTLAAAVDRLVLGPGSVGPAVAAAREALTAAEAVGSAAGRATDALPPVPSPAAGALGTGGRPQLPAGTDPAAVARWWAALPVAGQLALVEESPERLGALDGVPAWARDRANRVLLRRAIDDPRADDGLRAVARVVAGVLAEDEGAGLAVQLHLLDLAGDRVAVGYGDLDSADVVALVVPGMTITPADDLPGVAGDARDLAGVARRADPGLTVATVAWLGYRAPQFLYSATSRRAATTGGAVLDSALTGLAAARAATGAPPARTTVVGHSYGTVVIDEAADRTGRLAADAVVLLGSPGMEDDAAALEAPEVYDAASPADPISWSGWFGTETWAERFGSTGLPVDAGTGHSGYFDRDRPTLGAMGEVVVGRRPG